MLRAQVAFALAAAAVAPALPALAPSTPGGNRDWAVYRGDARGSQYASLAQIHAANVHRLRPAWTYNTGDATSRSTMHVNPIVVNGVMYISTPSLRAVALDAATGKPIWTFDPAPHNGGTVLRLRNRGVTYWRGAAGARIFHFVKDRVYALDAATGALLREFGRGGFIDLRRDLDVDPATVNLEMTSPGAVYQDVLVVGSRVNETYDASPGHIRGYDAATGAFTWIFHTIPRRGEPGHETWNFVDGERYGGANAWGGITVDEERGWVFCATGSATDDFYGAFRKGDNLFANSVLALDARTGARKWHYQTVRHDIWDYDNPPAPILVTLPLASGPRDAVVQLTKMGLTFVLDRDTGRPLFPVEERPVPPSDVPGEEAAATQPFPVRPPPLVRQSLTEADLTNITPESRAHALREFRRYVAGAIYTPPTVQGTLTQPGHLGGAQWHGGSFDASLGVLYVNVNDAPTINRLRAVDDQPGEGGTDPLGLGRRIYERTCIACHGADRRGTPPQAPALIGLTTPPHEMAAVITQGRNSMPAFAQLRPRELKALVAYLQTPATADEGAPAAARARRYTVDEYTLFNDPLGVPAVAPPWGTLNAVDLVDGRLLWRVPLGEYPHLRARGIRHTGTMNFGGAVATAGGVIFVAATADEKIRAFEQASGRLLWEHALPAGGYATPSIYMVGGRQFVTVAAGGGGKNATRSGDAVVTFALPIEDARPTAPGGRAGDGWIDLFDGTSLNGWAHLNGGHRFSVEDGAIVGRTTERSAATNSFLVTLEEFDDFELELDTTVDRITNQGIQIRTRVRPVAVEGRRNESFAGRVYGPQVEVRRRYPGLPTTGLLYGEALGTNWLSSAEKIAAGHRHFVDEGWNRLRIVARGPRIQTWVNGQPVEDLARADVYEANPSGRIGLQIHGLSPREIAQAGPAGAGLTSREPLVNRWRNIRIRALPR